MVQPERLSVNPHCFRPVASERSRWMNAFPRLRYSDVGEAHVTRKNEIQAGGVEKDLGEIMDQWGMWSSGGEWGMG